MASVAVVRSDFISLLQLLLRGHGCATAMFVNVGFPDAFRERRCVVPARDIFLGNRNV
jgi:hypothetical protein